MNGIILSDIPTEAIGWLYESRNTIDEEWTPVRIYHDFNIDFSDKKDFLEYEDESFEENGQFFKNHNVAAYNGEMPDFPGWCAEHPCDCCGWNSEENEFFRLSKVVLGPLSDEVKEFIKNHPGSHLSTFNQ